MTLLIAHGIETWEERAFGPLFSFWTAIFAAECLRHWQFVRKTM
jgi:hypothetical protein